MATGNGFKRRIGVALAAACLAGCMADLGPATPPDGGIRGGPGYSLTGSDGLAAERARIEAEREAQKETYKRALSEWKSGQKATRISFKQDPARPIELLGCEPEPYDGAAELIGPAGGTIKVGAHRLVIPPGALSSDVVITAEAWPGSLVGLDFRPHGLRFQRPVALTLSYKRCAPSTDRSLFVVYVGPEADPLELQVSAEKKDKKWVEAAIDHFSKYAVAYDK